MQVVADRLEPASRFVLSGVPKRPLWTGDELRAPDTVLGRAERKQVLVHAAENENLSDALQITLRTALVDAAEDDLTQTM
jgi:hypothetical protein